MSSKNSNKNAPKTVENKNVETVTETKTAQLNVEGLESDVVGSKHVVTESTPKFNDLAWLQENNPLDFVSDTVSSSKYDEVREPKIQDSLVLLSTLAIGGISINPLLILLGRWWEVKPARSEVKKMIDAEATEKGFDPQVYLQVELGKQVDAITEFQSAIDRVRYAKTYFKPRKELTSKLPTKSINIDGEIYLVPIQLLEAAKVDYAGKREELVEYLKSVSTVQDKTQIEEL